MVILNDADNATKADDRLSVIPMFPLSIIKLQWQPRPRRCSRPVRQMTNYRNRICF